MGLFSSGLEPGLFADRIALRTNSTLPTPLIILTFPWVSVLYRKQKSRNFDQEIGVGASHVTLPLRSQKKRAKNPRRHDTTDAFFSPYLGFARILGFEWD